MEERAHHHVLVFAPRECVVVTANAKLGHPTDAATIGIALLDRYAAQGFVLTQAAIAATAGDAVTSAQSIRLLAKVAALFQ